MIKRFKILAVIMAYYNAVCVTLLLIVWPFIAQSANPAFFPLMGATAMLGAVYAILARKSSYNNDRHVSNKNIAKKKK